MKHLIDANLELLGALREQRAAWIASEGAAWISGDDLLCFLLKIYDSVQYEKRISSEMSTKETRDALSRWLGECRAQGLLVSPLRRSWLDEQRGRPYEELILAVSTMCLESRLCPMQHVS
jgi:hypothetical protein